MIPLRIQNILRDMDRTSLKLHKTEVDDKINSLNTRYFKKQKIKLLKTLSNDRTTYITKLKIQEFFLDKLYNIIRPDDKLKNKLQESLYNLVRNAIDLSVVLRLRYFRYRNEKICFDTSVQLFREDIRNILPEVPYFQVLKYILKNSLLKDEEYTQILNEFEDLFDNPLISLFTKMEIADIFILNNKVERGHEMLQFIREQQQRRQGVVIDVNATQTIYDDSQNVHNKEINESVLRSACTLIKLYGETDFDEKEIIEELSTLSPVNRDIFKQIFERVQIDTARFKHGDNFFNLYQVFANLWVFIKKHKQVDDLKLRLVEEMIDMHKYCSTGHLSRFLNIIQGFTEHPDLCVTISNQTQIKAVVSRIIEKILVDAPGGVLDAMIEENKIPFTDYILKHFNKLLPDIIKEYGKDDDNIEEYILTSIVSYTKCETFRIENGKLVTPC